MYFIQEGIVDIVTKSGEVATSLSDGSYFGGIFMPALILIKLCKALAALREPDKGFT